MNSLPESGSSGTESPAIERAREAATAVSSGTPKAAGRVGWQLPALAAFAILSAFFPKLSMPAAFLTLVGIVAAPSSMARQKRIGLLGVAVLGAGIGFARFVFEEAIPGVLAGGKSAVEKNAVSHLRTILTAQDRSRTRAELDPDGDGIGTALTLRELGGLGALPNGRTISPPPLAFEPDVFTETAQGEAVLRSGYLFIVCLPAVGGGWTTMPSTRDAERGERHYLAYAWPDALGAGSPTTSYFVDEHERILMLEAEAGAAPRHVGTTRPPTCEAALTQPGWKPWQEKAPRTTLPGDAPDRIGTP